MSNIPLDPHLGDQPPMVINIQNMSGVKRACQTVLACILGHKMFQNRLLAFIQSL